MKQAREPKICEVRIMDGRKKLPTREPKTCEVKIVGKSRDPRTVKYGLTVAGMAKIVTQIANRLSRQTRSFKDGGGAIFTLPERQAIGKRPGIFKILLTQKIYTLAPRLRREEVTLTLVGESSVLFIPGAKDF